MDQVNKEKIKIGVGGAIGGAIITMIIGFAWGGWVSASTSLDRGEKMTRNAMVERLTPICVSQFNQDPEKDKKIQVIKEIDFWKRENYVKSQGWATMPFEKEPDSRVAKSCAEIIMKNIQKK